MQQVETGNPEVMTFRQPATWGWLFTVPLFLVVTAFGLYMFLGPFGLLQQAGDNGWIVALGGLFFFVFLYKGFRLIVDWFTRIGCTIDRSRNRAIAESGLFLHPLSETELSLDDYYNLYVSGVVTTRSHGPTSFEYSLHIAGLEEKPPVRIGRADDKGTIMAMAEKLAEFADLGIIDITYEPQQKLRTGRVQRDAIALVRKMLAERSEAEAADSGTSVSE